MGTRLDGWLKGRREAADQRRLRSMEKARVIAELAQMKADLVIRSAEEQAKERRRMLADERRRLLRRVEAQHNRVAPLGTPIEGAVEAVLYTVDEADRDYLRPTITKLARKFVKPEERVVGIVTKTGHSGRGRHKLVAVVSTNGFGVKLGSQQFRVERENARITLDVSENELDSEVAVVGTAHVTLGGEWIFASEDSRGRSQENLYSILATQARVAEDLKLARKRRRPSGAGRPKARLIRGHRDAELVAAEWMSYLGFTEIRPSDPGSDGGVDVWSKEAVAQVKAETSRTGRPKIQQHHGVAVSQKKRPVFFSLAGYTPPALGYAEANGVVLFTFDLQGIPVPANHAAHSILAEAERRASCRKKSF